MRIFEINEQQVKAIHDYLLSRPMAEIENAVYLLRSLQEIKKDRVEEKINKLAEEQIKEV